MTSARIHPVESWSDLRGDCWPIPDQALRFLGGVEEMHVVTSGPGAVRGNHYHEGRRECLFVAFEDGCRLAWAPSPGGPVEVVDLSGRGACWMEIEAGVPHAVENTGERPLVLVSVSDGRPEADRSDTFSETLLPS